MTAGEQPNQELFNYLANELNVIALLTQMLEIEAIVMSNHEQQIKYAYNQGFRDALEYCGNDINYKDEIAQQSNAEDYYNETFNK